jgi:hypothetical protein
LNEEIEVEELIQLSSMQIKSMETDILHENFLKIRSEIYKLERKKERSIDLEIVYCYFEKEIEERI